MGASWVARDAPARGRAQLLEPQKVSPAQLLCRLADGLLAGLPTLTATLVHTIVASDPAYDELPAERLADLQRSCRDNLERILQLLCGAVPDGVDRFDAPDATGRRRAAQGVPLEAVLHAYRLGGRVIWEAMADSARAGGATAVDALLDAATSVWEVVDLYSGRVADAYRSHEWELARSGEERRQRVLDTLLEGRGADAAVAREAEQVLDLGERDSFVLLACRPTLSSADWARATAHALRGRGLRSVWRTRPDGTVGLVVPDRRGPAEVAAVLLPDQAVGVSPRVEGFAGIGEGWRLARVALATLPEGDERVVTLDQRLVPALLVRDAALAQRLMTAALGPVLDLPDPDRGLLLDTLETWLDCGGSPSRAAELLWCHRNTVLNRLRRLESLTGRAVDRPHDLVELALALAQARQALPRQARAPTHDGAA